MKYLSGTDLASYVKERQSRQIPGLDATPTLLIIRDSNLSLIHI